MSTYGNEYKEVSVMQALHHMMVIRCLEDCDEYTGAFNSKKAFFFLKGWWRPKSEWKEER